MAPGHLRVQGLWSHLLKERGVKLWLQQLVAVLVDNVSNLLLPTDMGWVVGVTLQPLPSADVDYSLSDQKPCNNKQPVWIITSHCY